MGGSGTSAVQNDPDMNAICGVNTNNGVSSNLTSFLKVHNSLSITYSLQKNMQPMPHPATHPIMMALVSLSAARELSGPYSNSSVNIALIPSTTVPVSINNVNCVTILTIISQIMLALAGALVAEALGKLQTLILCFLNAYTTVFQATVTVVACTTYHIKLAVANADDQSLNTGVFLQESSFSSNPIDVTTTYSNPLIDTTMVEGWNQQSSLLVSTHSYLTGYYSANLCRYSLKWY